MQHRRTLLSAVTRTSSPSRCRTTLGYNDTLLIPERRRQQALLGSLRAAIGSSTRTLPLSAISPLSVGGQVEVSLPMYRGYNTTTKGVIYDGGTVGISGTVRGSVTIYTPQTVCSRKVTFSASPTREGASVSTFRADSPARTKRLCADNADKTTADIRYQAHHDL